MLFRSGWPPPIVHPRGADSATPTLAASTWPRLVNAVFTFLIGIGLAPAQSRILSVSGRRTGREYRTPVNLVLREGQRYLVSPYGDRAWTLNARAAGSVTLRRGSTVETVTLQELDATEAGPVLRQYVWENAITRPFFDAARVAAT